MGFEVFMQRFEHGQPAGVSADIVRALFTHIAADSEPDYWRIKYAKGNSCDVSVTRSAEDPEKITALTIDRPTSDARLWDSLYGVLKLGNWVLYFPAEPPPIIVAAKSDAGHMPPDMREALGAVRVVKSGKEIEKLIRTS